MVTVEVQGLDWHEVPVDKRTRLEYLYLTQVHHVRYPKGYLILCFMNYN